MRSTRRFGGEESPTRDLLLDAAEKLMIEEGYGAVTSRKLAARAGLKHQIVYYYFHTMDDLFLAVRERLGRWFLDRVNEALASEHPIRALWEIASHRQSAALEMEFMALANHRKPIRAELARELENYRSAGIDALTRYLAICDVDPLVTPLAVAVLSSSVGRHMALEESLGVTRGHAQTRALVEHLLGTLETMVAAPKPAREKAKTARAAPYAGAVKKTRRAPRAEK